MAIQARSTELAMIIPSISNKREWNNCLIKNAPKILGDCVVGLPQKLLFQDTAKIKNRTLSSYVFKRMMTTSSTSSIRGVKTPRILVFISASFDTVSDVSYSSISSACLLITAANAKYICVYVS